MGGGCGLGEWEEGGGGGVAALAWAAKGKGKERVEVGLEWRGGDSDSLSPLQGRRLGWISILQPCPRPFNPS